MIPTLNIIGAGKLGKTLGRLWNARGVFQVQDLVNRDLKNSLAAARFIDAGRPVAKLCALRPAAATLIAVGDDQIESIASELANSPGVNAAGLVFHCSGALPSTALQGLRATGAAIASAHPLASFADPEAMLGGFAGTYCAIEGDAAAVERLESAFAAIGGIPVRIDVAAKPLYHAAAVFSSNYLVTLMEVAQQLYAKAGIGREVAAAMMRPLAQGALDTSFRLGPAQALTGPIARGDAATVLAQHGALLGAGVEYAELYRQLAHFAAGLAGKPDPLASKPSLREDGGRGI